MALGSAAIVFVLCVAGGGYALRVWLRRRKRGLLALWIVLGIMAAICVLYMAMAAILLSAV